MTGGITFRQAIENNKRMILEFLKTGKHFTRDIHDFYGGDKDMAAVRKALNELRKEGKIKTDDHVYFWQGKLWEIV